MANPSSCPLGALVLLLGALLEPAPAGASAEACPGTDPSILCRVSSGTYYARIPRSEALDRKPVALLLHDAGRDAHDIISDKNLVGAFMERGYAVIAPNATRRSYVRANIERRTRPGRVSKSDRKYVVQRRDGSLRELRESRDRGWYFQNTDIIIRRTRDAGQDRRTEDPGGRNEPAFLARVLDDAAQRFMISTDNVVVVGFGHGASLAWQMACTKPGFARIFAPVNGVYWSEPPVSCQPGGRVFHTHETASTFWPTRGTPSTRTRFGQAGVMSTLETFARIHDCSITSGSSAPDGLGNITWTWGGCMSGASAELLQLSEPFRLQVRWLDRVLDTGLAASRDAVADPPGQGDAMRPRFLKPRYPEVAD